jgi:hypothetical protein
MFKEVKTGDLHRWETNISRMDRLRFLKTYTSLHPIIKDEKGFVTQLVQQSKERGMVYVFPQGVVEENWV